MSSTVLVVEDCSKQRKMIRHGLVTNGYDVIEAGSADDALRMLRAKEPDIFLIDLHLPDRDGFSLCADLMEDTRYALIPRLMLTADSTLEKQIEGLTEYADDYLVKPFDFGVLTARMAALLRRSLKNGPVPQVVAQPVDLEPVSDNPLYQVSGSGFIGKCEAMQRVYSTLHKFADNTAPVLITGESGTGKELAARTIHDMSPRKSAPFVPINCGAIPDMLLEAELFGYEKGAFTGAHARKKGRVEMAQGGTLFLDEIGELPQSLQVKLLRFLETYKIERIGGIHPLEVDVRVVAATNKNLKQAIEQGEFREDLYFRLAVLSVELPALRERGEDKVIIANALLTRFAEESSRDIKGLTPEALAAIRTHPWPGNVRELANHIRRAVILAEGQWIKLDDLGLLKRNTMEGTGAPTSLHQAKEQAERVYLSEALARHQGNISQVARELGISRPTLYDRIKKYNLRS